MLGRGHDSLPDTRTIIVDLGTGAYLGDRDDSSGDDYSTAVTTGVADGIGEPAN